MIRFPNAKINLGLNIIEKRPDGFHNLETVFYPVGWTDILEIVSAENTGQQVDFKSSGIIIDGASDSNLCVRAYQLLKADFDLPSVHMHLHKIIPIGAGLGGGSSDAAFSIKIINELFDMHLSVESMQGYARQLGSDCAFFIENKPVYAFERGDVFENIQLDLSRYYIALVKPDIHVSTVDAYAGVVPEKPVLSIRDVIQLPIDQWKDKLVNDFERSVLKKHSSIAEIKERLYDTGALYASMSGSGSCVYGIFAGPPTIKKIFPQYYVWEGSMRL